MKFWKCHVIGIAITFSPFTGINPLIVYATKMFNFFDPKYNAVLGCVIITGLNTIIVISIIFTVKMFPRRFLIKVGGTLLCISLLIITLIKAFVLDHNL